MKHSLTGGSNAHLWWYCPGSVYLCKVVENKVGKAAERGTVMHEVAATRLNGGGLGPMLSAKEQEIVDAYLKAVRISTNRPIVEREVYSHLTEFAFGTIDVMWKCDNGKVNVCDLKTGKTPVSPIMNEQLLTYAYWHMSHHYPDSYAPPILHICQPTISPDLQTWEPSEAEWASAKKTIDWALDQIYGGGTPPLIKGNHCSKCRASAFCPKYKESALSAEW